MSRLPKVGGDDQIWGDLLNDFLNVEHNIDGTLKARADGSLYAKPAAGIPRSDLHADVQTALDTIGTAVVDASATEKGRLQLVGDLTGSAGNPRVKSRTSITIGTSSADYNFSEYPSVQACIQAAFNDYSAVGAVVTLKEPCTLTGSVRPRSNITFTAVKGVVITFNSGHISGVPAAGNGGFHAFETDSTVTNCTFDSLQFNGGLTSLQTGIDGQEYHALYMRHGSSRFTIKNIYGTRTASGVVRVRDTCTNFLVEHIEAYQADCAIIITVGCNDFRVKNIKAKDVFAEGIFMGSDVYNFALDNIYIDNAGTRGLSINNDYTPATKGGYQANISNITTINCQLQGVYLIACEELNITNLYARGNLRDGILMSACYNLTIAECQSWNNNRIRVSDGSSQYSGIRIFDSKHISLVNPLCDDDSLVSYQYRGIDSNQSVAGATDFIKVTGGRSENTTSNSQAVVIGNNSTVINHHGYNPRRYSDRGNVSATPQILLKNGDTQRIILTQDSALQTFDTNAIPGQQLTIIVAQNNVGGWQVTFPANATLTQGTFTPDTTASAVSSITFAFVSSSLGWYEIARADKSSTTPDAFLTAIAGTSANGFLARTSTNTAASRSLTGTTNQIIVTNGDGVASDPVFSLPQNIHTAATPTFNQVIIGSTSTFNNTADIIGSFGTGHIDIAARGSVRLYLDSNNNGTTDVFSVYNNGNSTVIMQLEADTPRMRIKAGASTGFMSVGGTMFDHFADVGNTGTSETDLYSDIIPASTLNTNGDKINASYGLAIINSTSTKQIKVYYSGNVIFDSGVLTTSAAASMSVDVHMIRDSSTSIRYNLCVTTTGMSTASFARAGTVTGLTLSGTTTLKITGTAAGAGAATNDIVAKLGSVEYRPVA
jgi:hypothetical protein